MTRTNHFPLVSPRPTGWRPLSQYSLDTKLEQPNTSRVGACPLNYDHRICFGNRSFDQLASLSFAQPQTDTAEAIEAVLTASCTQLDSRVDGIWETSKQANFLEASASPLPSNSNRIMPSGDGGSDPLPPLLERPDTSFKRTPLARSTRDPLTSVYIAHPSVEQRAGYYRIAVSIIPASSAPPLIPVRLGRYDEPCNAIDCNNS